MKNVHVKWKGSDLQVNSTQSLIMILDNLSEQVEHNIDLQCGNYCAVCWCREHGGRDETTSGTTVGHRQNLSTLSTSNLSGFRLQN